MTRATSDSAEEQLRTFIDKFDPKHRTTIRAARKALRKRFPTANELVYDNYNFFVIGFGPSERPSDCFVSIAAAANGVCLCFIRGARLPDTARILSGSGNRRVLRAFLPGLHSMSQRFRLCFRSRLTGARVPLPLSGRGKLIIRSVAAKQQPRRKPQKAKPGDAANREIA